MGDLLLTQDHSTLHLAHDGNLDAFASYFDLEWEAPPFQGGKLIPTPPTSALRFVMDHDAQTVTASFVYIPFDQPIEESSFKESPIKTWKMKQFVSAAMTKLRSFSGAEECFRKPPMRKE